MYIEKKCVSDRNVRICLPLFRAGEGAGRREKRAVRRMNGYYRAMEEEMTAYVRETAGANPKVLYTAETEWHLPAEEGWSVREVLSVRITLSLRCRPEPTRRRVLVQTWSDGYLCAEK